EPDEHTSINDFDCYGKSEFGTMNGYWQVRPDGMDGAASVIRYDRHGSLWWQPPADWASLTPEVQTDLRHRVRELIEFGFRVGIITAYGTAIDNYGRDHTVTLGCTTLGGLDSDLDADTVQEMVDEIELGVRAS